LTIIPNIGDNKNRGDSLMGLKPIIWVASSKRDLEALSDEIRDVVGYALFQAQAGGKSDRAKALKGFGSAAILEVVEYSVGGTYRAVYTVKFREVIAVLHVFQKKSTHGIKTSKQDIELIKNRLSLAEQEYKAWLLNRKEES
jgi:phage-related protein